MLEEKHSKMTIEEVKAFLTVVIQEVVNGKIDKIDLKLDAYIKEDMAWKDRAEPVLELGNSLRGASKLILYLTGLIITIGGAWLTIKSIWK